MAEKLFTIRYQVEGRLLNQLEVNAVPNPRDQVELTPGQEPFDVVRILWTPSSEAETDAIVVLT